MKINLTKAGFRPDYDPENRFNLSTYLKNYIVSTVDLGMNHELNINKPPLYYEIMVFNREDGSSIYQVRYRNVKDAINGHIEMLKELENEIK